MKTFDEAMKMFDDKKAKQLFMENLKESCNEIDNAKYRQTMQWYAADLLAHLVMGVVEEGQEFLEVKAMELVLGRMHMVFNFGKIMGMEMEKAPIDLEGLLSDKKGGGE